MNQKKDLSIIIPVYNVEKFIDECLKSILNYEDLNYEVIVINDGTPDNSMKIILKYKEIYNDKVRIINQDNQGLSITRNNGIHAAQGEYIWFIDSDDYLKTNAIKEVIKILKENKGINIISMPLNHCFENGKETQDFTLDKNLTVSNYQYLKNNFPFGASPRFIIKKEFILNNQLYFIPKILHEDGEFGLRMLYYVDNILIIKQSYYNYRIRSCGSIMSSWKEKNSNDLLSIFDSLITLFKKNPLNRELEYFTNALFSILVASVIFAKEKWDSPIFLSFYKNHKYEIRERTKILFPYFSLNGKTKLLLFYMTPLHYCKVKIGLNRLRRLFFK